MVNSDLVIIGSVILGLIILMFSINLINPQFRAKLPFLIKRINSKEVFKIILKISGIVVFFYFAGGGGFEYDKHRLISMLLLFVSLFSLIFIGMMSAIDKFPIKDLTQKEVRKAKLKKINKKYKIKIWEKKLKENF